MYTVVEYINYRKEIDISVHGYFDNYENALNYSKEKARKTMSYDEENNIIGINGIDCDIDMDVYTYTSNVKDKQNNNILSNVKKELCRVTFRKINEDDYNDIKEAALLNLNEFDKEINEANQCSGKSAMIISNFFKMLPNGIVPLELFEKIYSNISTNNAIEDYENEILDILQRMNLEFINTLERNDFISDNLITSISSQIFAIIEINKNTFTQN